MRKRQLLFAVTNAAGSLRADVPVGTSASPRINAPFPLFHGQFLTCFFYRPLSVVIIDDHIALPLLSGLNPLLGPLTRSTSTRFVPLSDAYSRSLRLAAFRAAHTLGLQRDALAEGAYAWVSGPTYETRAEAAFLASAGASVVGMSTVPEVVAARDENLKVLVLSLVTNMVVGVGDGGKRRSVKEELEAEVRAR
jgi:purine-nucleoside phosphorylase